MSQTSFRAGSGSYQAVRPLSLTITGVPGFATATETYSAAGNNITTGAIADLTTDSLTTAEFANPGAVAGLILENSYISSTGVLTLVYYNETALTITPAAATQVNLLVF